MRKEDRLATVGTLCGSDTSETIRKTLSQYDIRTAFRVDNKVQRKLTKSKDSAHIAP